MEDGGSWPASPLWDYAVALYGQPGVAAACLALQDRRGVDVNLLLFGCWLGATGRRLDMTALAPALDAARLWQTEVVRPLRHARRALKHALAGLGDLRPPLETARRELARIELAAERVELARLGRAGGQPYEPMPNAALTAAALRRFVALTPEDAPEVEVILRAAFPALRAEQLRVVLEQTLAVPWTPA